MKKNIFYSLMLAGVALSLTGCSDDDLSSTSVITVAQEQQVTPLDKWLKANLLDPYNIEVKYRYEYNETDNSYYTIPADYEQSVEMAHIIKYSCVEAYNEVAGVDFTRRYFPKMFFLIGEWQYRNNGSFELGTAEGGKKINLMGINYIDQYKTSLETLNTYYLKTVHHEFTHILNQTTDYSANFQMITSTGYVSDKCFDDPYNTGYLTRGFISAYSQTSHAEDFAEMLSEYVTNTAEQWHKWMYMKHWYVTEINPITKETIGNETYYGDETNNITYKVNDEFSTGSGTSAKTYRVTSIKTTDKDKLDAKLDIVRDYMQKTFNIDIDKLRETVLRREQDIVDGKIDLKDVTVK